MGAISSVCVTSSSAFQRHPRISVCVTSDSGCFLRRAEGPFLLAHRARAVAGVPLVPEVKALVWCFLYARDPGAVARSAEVAVLFRQAARVSLRAEFGFVAGTALRELLARPWRPAKFSLALS